MAKKILLTIVLMVLLSFISTACRFIPVEAELTSTSIADIMTMESGTQPATEESQTVPPKETTAPAIYPIAPERPGFTDGWDRPLEMIAGPDSVILCGNGAALNIAGYVKGTRENFYPQGDTFEMCGVGRYKIDDNPAIQYSVDRSVFAFILKDEDQRGETVPGKLVIYDGSTATDISADVWSFALSADGQKILYRSDNTDRERGDNLFFYDVKTGESYQVSDCAGPSYCLSLLGQTFLYMEYDSSSITTSSRVMIKTEGEDARELATDMIPAAVGDDGTYAYALEESKEETCNLWVFSGQESRCIGENVLLTTIHPILFNSECSEAIFFADGNYLSREGETGVKLAIEGSIFDSTAFSHPQYQLAEEDPEIPGKEISSIRYCCTDSLQQVILLSSSKEMQLWLSEPDADVVFWFFDHKNKVQKVSKEEALALYEGQEEYLTNLNRAAEQEAYIYRVQETVFHRKGMPDVMYYLDTTNGGRQAASYIDPWNISSLDEGRQSYIGAHYFDLYMLEAPYDGTPVRVAENVSQVWSDGFGVYYVSLIEIDQNLIAYFKEPDKYFYLDEDSGTYFNELCILGDTNGIYFSPDGITFALQAETMQRYYPAGIG